jgi:hypothetical protein
MQDAVLGVCGAHLAAWCCGRRCHRHTGEVLTLPPAMTLEHAWLHV